MTVAEICDGLYVGDVVDADKWDGAILNVASEHVGRVKKAISLPWFTIKVDVIFVNKVNLDATSDIIDLLLKSGQKVLVHCNMG